MMRRYLRFFVPVSFMLLVAATAWAGGEPAAQGHAQAPSLTVRMATLMVQLGAILFATRIGNKLFEKIHLPGVLGELCAGILIGPYLLGGIPLPLHGMEHGLFHLPAAMNAGTDVSPELYGLCAVASIVLLFLVGVETDLRMFIRYSAVGSLVGIGGVVVSFLSGNWVGQYFLGLPWDSAACLFLGVMSTATSVSITARILSERRKLDAQEGVTILAGAVIDDVLGMILLTVCMGLIKAKSGGNAIDWLSIGGISLKAVGIWLGATVAGVALARWIARGIKPLGSQGEMAILALGLALVMGGLFEQAQLAMIIGAYVMGLSFSRTELNYVIQTKLHPIHTFLAPVFFAVMGMMVNVNYLLDPKILAFGLVYTVVAILAKLVGCGLPTALFGFNGLGMLRVGVGMVPRGEVALIVAGVAKVSNMLGEDVEGKVFSVAVMMTLITTLISPSMLVALFNIRKPGMRAATQGKEEEERPIATYHFPNTEVAKLIIDKVMQNLSKEGFFAHCINAEEGLYQARKDDTSITMQLSGTTINFDSALSVSGFVRVVMSESMADFEQALLELRKPVEATGTVSLSDKEELAIARRRDILRRYLNEAFLVPHLNGTTPREVIAELLGVLRKAGHVRDEKQALDLVMKREDVMPTGVGHGVACPHARTDSVGGLICAVGLSKEGISFTAEDGEPCRIILLTLTPSSAVSPYMTFITAALSALQSGPIRERLLQAETSHEIRAAFID